MRKLTIFLLAILVVFTSCKKNDENTEWTQEDEAFCNGVISLQDSAYNEYVTWSQTLDSVEAINKLQQLFVNDPFVTSATVGSQGIAVQYSNGMRGGIFLNPLDYPETNKSQKRMDTKRDSLPTNIKSKVNAKKMILLDPHYWDRKFYTDNMVLHYNQDLPKVDFTLETVFNTDATVDRFFQISGNGIIQVYSHGWAWPSETNIVDVYVMTGELENSSTTDKYKNEIKSGSILIAPTLVNIIGPDSIFENVYWISGGEFAVKTQNNFKNDTILFYGGFCYSFFGHWPYINQTFAQGAYFGFNWTVLANYCCNWATNLITNLSDNNLDKPITTEDWMNNPYPKSYLYKKDNRTVNILYSGDPNLTLWEKENLCDGFPPIGEIRTYLNNEQNFGVQLICEEVTELIQDKEVFRQRISTDPPNIGSYYACDSVLGRIKVAEDNALPPYQRDLVIPPQSFIKYGATIGETFTWQGMNGSTSSKESYLVIKYQDISVPVGKFTNTMMIKANWYIEETLLSEEYYWVDKKMGLLKFVTIGEMDTLYLSSYTSPNNKANIENWYGFNTKQIIESIRKKRY